MRTNRAAGFTLGVTLGFSAVASLATAPGGVSVFRGTLLEPNQRTLEISTEEVRKILAEGRSFVLDARPFMEYAVSHVPGALNAAKPGGDVRLRLDVRRSSVWSAATGEVGPVLQWTLPAKRRPKNSWAPASPPCAVPLGIPVWRALGGLTQIELEGVSTSTRASRPRCTARGSQGFGGSLTGPQPPRRSCARQGRREVKKAKDDGRLPMEDRNTPRCVQMAPRPVSWLKLW
jgi:rhodanese-related sulfurtransferase